MTFLLKQAEFWKNVLKSAKLIWEEINTKLGFLVSK